ncbi:molybdopterin-dependent oxidoreductase [Collinsella sp. An2]|uniref:molybdopterin-containing oxidoreductase family protein n=1 Tax=Collinsella sp. An2 TaxID=1965585 RepID=UPI000B388BE2|nr:molybdopterin-dependent oxidoreductase [Collinsella sp. An2]OUP08009.1 hypothetical protein B5F33_07705 [Collinsella sp. An2]
MGVWKKTCCYNCGVCCGLDVEVEDNKVVNVRPDKNSMRSLGGYCCRKGRSLKYFQDNGNRLNHPLKRVGDEFVEISWEQALSEIGAKINEIRAQYGPKAFGCYGVGLAVDQVEMYPLHDLGNFLGTQWWFNPLSVEFMAPWWSNGKFVGRQFPPIEGETSGNDVFMIWGANTYVSHNVGNARQVIRECSEDPNRMFIVVDPCLTETARMADMHIKPRPGSDALLVRALISIIVKNGWQDQEYLDAYTTGWDQAKAWFEDFDIDGALEVCGVPREQAEEFAKILSSKTWGVHVDLGIFFGRNSTLSCYLINMLAAVTGNLMRPGTNVIANGYLAWGPYTDEHTSECWRTWKTNSFPTLGYYPGGCLQECMEDPNEADRLRCLFVTAGNPARSFPDSSSLVRDFKNLDLLVVVDVEMSETCRCADYVLPGTTGYERFGATIFTGGYPYSTLTFKHPILEVAGERRDDSEIWVDIMDAAGFIPTIPDELYVAAQAAVDADDRLAILQPVKDYLTGIGRMDALMPVLYKVMGRAMGSVGRAVFWAQFIYGELNVKNAVRVGYALPHKHPELEDDPETMPLVIRDQVFAAVDASPSGTVIAGADGTIEGALEDQVMYPDKKIHLFDETVDEHIVHITPEEEGAKLAMPKEYPFLVSAGTHSEEGVNTIMRNPASYRYRQPYIFRMNPEDARDMGLADGQWVRVTSKAGSITVPVKYSRQTARGYGNIPHHFGLYDEHGKAYGDAVNKLTSGEDVDEITGDPFYRYVPCRVEALKEGEVQDVWNYAK